MGLAVLELMEIARQQLNHLVLQLSLTANNGKPCFDLAVGMTNFDVKKYELHIESTIKMIEAAKEYGREDMIEANEKNLERYQDIYDTIKSGSVIFGNLERMQRKLERLRKKGVKNGQYRPRRATKASTRGP